MTKLFKLGLFAFASALPLQGAFAQQADQPPQVLAQAPGTQPMYATPPSMLPMSPWYITLSGAAAFPENTRFDVFGASGKIEYGTGLTAFLALGYRFNPWLSAEIEAGYLRLPFDKISVGSASVDVDGRLHALAGFGNIVLTVPDWGTVTPYVAAGAGVVHRFSSDVSVGGINASLGSETDFAAQGKVGVSFRLSQHISLAPEYRYLWINTSGDGLRNTHVHTIGAQLKFNY